MMTVKVREKESDSTQGKWGEVLKVIATLWAIAESRFGDGIRYVEVFEANRDRIKNPDLIYPGQVFRVPEADE